MDESVSLAGFQDWFILAVFILIAALYLGLLMVGFKKQRFDNLECSKYSVFTHDPFPRDQPEPEPPLYCRLQFGKQHRLRGDLGLNTRWIWLVFLMWASWILAMGGTFIYYHSGFKSF